MKEFSIDSAQEFLELKATYQSEGFGVYLRLLDSVIGQLYNKVVDDKTSDADVLRFVNQIKGLSVAKNISYNAIKENEFKFKKD